MIFLCQISKWPPLYQDGRPKNENHIFPSFYYIISRKKHGLQESTQNFHSDTYDIRVRTIGFVANID